MICTDFQKTSKLSQKTYVATIWKIAKKKKHASTWRQRLGFFHKKFMAWKLWCNFPNDLRVYTKGKKISNFGESFFLSLSGKNFPKRKTLVGFPFFSNMWKKNFFFFAFFFFQNPFWTSHLLEISTIFSSKKTPFEGLVALFQIFATILLGFKASISFQFCHVAKVAIILKMI